MRIDEAYETHSLTWTEVAAMVKKYWTLVLVVFVSGTLGTYLALQLFFTTQYETKAKLLVKVGRETAELPPTVLNGQVLNQGVRIADINSEVELLSSRTLAEQVVDEMGPASFKFEPKPPESILGYPKYIVKKIARFGKRQYQELLIFANIKKRLTDREKAIVAVSEGVTVEPVKESDVLVLKVRMPDPQLSAQVANRVLKFYMDERAKARKMSAPPDLFQAQLQQQRDRLKAMIGQRDQIRRDWRVSSADQQRGLLLQELSKIRLDLHENESEIAQLQIQQASMSSKLSSVPQMLPKERIETRNPSIQTIKERLTNLEVERTKLATSYQPDSEIMKRNQAEINDLRAALEKEAPSVAQSTTTELNPVVRDFNVGVESSSVRIDGLKKRNEELLASMARINADIERVNRGGDAYETLEREYQIAERSYVEYSKKQEDARISEALDAQRLPNVVVMGAPEIPLEPVYPRHLFILAFAMPISLLLGIALAALLESFDDRVRDDRSIEGMEYLGKWVLEVGAPASGD